MLYDLELASRLWQRALAALRGYEMTSVLLAGSVVSKPKSDAFPPRGLPKACVHVRVGTITYPIVGYETHVEEIEALQIGDSLSVQGELVLDSKRVLSHIIAEQISPLRRRSINKLQVMAKATG